MVQRRVTSAPPCSKTLQTSRWPFWAAWVRDYRRSLQVGRVSCFGTLGEGGRAQAAQSRCCRYALPGQLSSEPSRRAKSTACAAGAPTHQVQRRDALHLLPVLVDERDGLVDVLALQHQAADCQDVAWRGGAWVG
jgi:hypothetical protein